MVHAQAAQLASPLLPQGDSGAHIWVIGAVQTHENIRKATEKLADAK